MTRLQAERIMGLGVTVSATFGRKVTHYAMAMDGDMEIARAEGVTQSLALQALVGIIYKRRSAQVMREQGYRCAKCKAIKPLTIHHKKFRSHGRDDSVENLLALCRPCHGGEHGER
jgi:HNH endonuclease